MKKPPRRLGLSSLGGGPARRVVIPAIPEESTQKASRAVLPWQRGSGRADVSVPVLQFGSGVGIPEAEEEEGDKGLHETQPPLQRSASLPASFPAAAAVAAAAQHEDEVEDMDMEVDAPSPLPKGPAPAPELRSLARLQEGQQQQQMGLAGVLERRPALAVAATADPLRRSADGLVGGPTTSHFQAGSSRACFPPYPSACGRLIPPSLLPPQVPAKQQQMPPPPPFTVAKPPVAASSGHLSLQTPGTGLRTQAGGATTAVSVAPAARPPPPPATAAAQPSASAAATAAAGGSGSIGPDGRKRIPREDESYVIVHGVRYTKLECVGKGGSSKVFKVCLPRHGEGSQLALPPPRFALAAALAYWASRAIPIGRPLGREREARLLAASDATPTEPTASR